MPVNDKLFMEHAFPQHPLMQRLFWRHQRVARSPEDFRQPSSCPLRAEISPYLHNILLHVKYLCPHCSSRGGCMETTSVKTQFNPKKRQICAHFFLFSPLTPTILSQAMATHFLQKFIFCALSHVCNLFSLPLGKIQPGYFLPAALREHRHFYISKYD